MSALIAVVNYGVAFFFMLFRITVEKMSQRTAATYATICFNEDPY
jgi:hypothetical protein